MTNTNSKRSAPKNSGPKKSGSKGPGGKGPRNGGNKKAGNKKSANKSWAKSDPHHEREKQKYGTPAPSRELLKETLENADAPMSYNEVVAALGVTDDNALEGTRRRLGAMVRDGQLVQNRKGGFAPLEALDLYKGRVSGHRDGFGFFITDDDSDDIFLAARQMRTLMHGDKAVARVTGLDDRGRREGSIVEVLERNTKEVVGRFYMEAGIGFVEPDNSRHSKSILVPGDWRGEAEHGQIVEVELVEQPSKRTPPIGRVTSILGRERDPGLEIDIAMRSHNIPFKWPADVEAQCKKFGKSVPAKAKTDRVDFRDIPLVTIDGADSKDFDDAVYCEKKGRGWRLLVAIADVSHYVDGGSPLDMEAATRGNSVYFPQQVIPMLPEVLSNGLCSLNPNVERLCMVCEMTVNAQGKVTAQKFYNGLMKSHARLTYDQTAQMLGFLPDSLPEQKIAPKHKKVLPHLEELYSLYQAMRKQRTARGAIDFDTVESRIVFDDERKIDRIEATVRHDAHKIIEECMIAANVSSAKFLAKNKMPTLYRTHGGPKVEKIDDLREFLKVRGLHLPGGSKPTPQDYAETLALAGERDDAELIQTVMLRSMSQAVYSPDNGQENEEKVGGHFGLALEEYLHFTSPIRRYPDLLVHRGIRHIINGGKAKDFPYSESDMAALGENCSMTERRADEAVRDAVDWLKCEFMQDRVGEEFEGRVAGVTSFGIFVALNDIHVEGLVHVTSLPGDYYHFDSAGHQLKGERTGKAYRLSDTLRVKVVRVSLDDRKIDFEPVGGNDASDKPAAAPNDGRKPKARKKPAAKKANVEQAEAQQPEAQGPEAQQPEAKKPAARKPRAKKPTVESAEVVEQEVAKPAARKPAAKKAATKPEAADEAVVESKPAAKPKPVKRKPDSVAAAGLRAAGLVARPLKEPKEADAGRKKPSERFSSETAAKRAPAKKAAAKAKPARDRRKK